MIKEKNKKIIIIILSIFFIISILSIYSASKLNFSGTSLVAKQIIWYVVGLIIILLICKFNINKIIDKAFLFYAVNNILLLLLLFFGKEINGSRCWFQIPGIGSFQPSEFMKLSLILVNAKILSNQKNSRSVKEDIIVIMKIFLVTLLPSVLTFLEPDTGMVIIYFFISICMLFAFGIKKSILITLSAFFIIILSLFLYNYFYNQDKFIDVFGTSFFYRIDRIIDWQNKSGMQLNNALAAIKAAGIFGFGLANTPIYFPEAHTDFIFSIFASNFGFFGALFLILLIIAFDATLINMAIKEKNKLYKYFIIGFTSMIIYQQLQNIGMNIGLLPITGITLPFISYGGSSLLSYLIGIGLVIGYKKSSKRQNNLI